MLYANYLSLRKSDYIQLSNRKYPIMLPSKVTHRPTPNPKLSKISSLLGYAKDITNFIVA